MIFAFAGHTRSRRLIVRVVSAGAMATALLAPIGGPGAVAAPVPTYSGRVVDESGSPISGVVVINGRYEHVTTGPDGRFSIQASATAWERLRLEMSHFPETGSYGSYLVMETASMNPTSDVNFGDVRVPRPRLLKVRFQDRDGDAVLGVTTAGAEKYLDRDGFGSDEFHVGIIATSQYLARYNPLEPVELAYVTAIDGTPIGSDFGFTSQAGSRHVYAASELEQEGDEWVLRMDDVDVPAPQLPSKPVVSVQVQNSSALVKWPSVDSNNGGDIVYSVWFDGNQVHAGGFSGMPQSPFRVTGLTPGMVHSLIVRAENHVGSVDSDPVTVVHPTVPAIPAAPKVKVGKKAGKVKNVLQRRVTISWVPPSNERAPITQYRVRVEGFRNVVKKGKKSKKPFKRTINLPGTATKTNVTLSQGEYTLTLYARNPIGMGEGSPGTRVKVK